jgi:hypothetical protein
MLLRPNRAGAPSFHANPHAHFYLRPGALAPSVLDQASTTANLASPKTFLAWGKAHEAWTDVNQAWPMTFEAWGNVFQLSDHPPEASPEANQAWTAADERSGDHREGTVKLSV